MLFRLFALVLALAAASPASAYWEYGHETVAKIAVANVRPATRLAIRRLLARQSLLDTPECLAGTIEQASIWADCIKPLKAADGSSRFGYAYNWHFQNADICRDFDLTPACKDGNCVSAQIERQAAILRDRHAGQRARVMALAFLIHFVGDLHQPLHAGDKSDRGGNDAAMAYGIYAPARLNLHSIWDGLLAERAISAPPTLVRRYAPRERARLAAGSVADWSRESWQVARTAYDAATGGRACAPFPARGMLDAAAIERLVPVARLEVQRGGLRLARMLDRALG
ncbi:S1/P1 nuclease [Sphingomonas sp.]|jgi:hypothetical protein|uniref:S1/P1 nuclease n=1 Tax=Sphingomonas sp. TaxID=28214 RepID=UPI002ED89445